MQSFLKKLAVFATIKLIEKHDAGELIKFVLNPMGDYNAKGIGYRNNDRYGDDDLFTNQEKVLLPENDFSSQRKTNRLLHR